MESEPFTDPSYTNSKCWLSITKGYLLYLCLGAILLPMKPDTMDCRCMVKTERDSHNGCDML